MTNEQFEKNYNPHQVTRQCVTRETYLFNIISHNLK